jgi:hypothetical protein
MRNALPTDSHKPFVLQPKHALVFGPLLVVLAFAACPSTPAATTPTLIGCDGAPYGESFMKGVIATLAQPAWEGRKFDSEGLKKAETWVKTQFACVGLQPGAGGLPGLPTGSFEQAFDTDGDQIEPSTEISNYSYDAARKYSFTSVIGHIPGAGDLAGEYVVVGAHIDHMGKYGKEGNQLVVGADDDASGILALLSMARQLSADAAPASRRTLVFAAWGVEEDPFYLRGSKAFFSAIAAADPAGKDKLMYYVNFDMVAGYRDQSNVNVMGTFPGSVARRLMEGIAVTHPDIQTDLGDRGSSSDHATFCENGVPYAFFWTQDSCYHKPCDTADRVDYIHMATILKEATELANALAIEPDLKTAKEEWPTAFAAAYPGETCTTQP